MIQIVPNEILILKSLLIWRENEKNNIRSKEIQRKCSLKEIAGLTQPKQYLIFFVALVWMQVSESNLGARCWTRQPGKKIGQKETAPKLNKFKSDLILYENKVQK